MLEKYYNIFWNWFNSNIYIYLENFLPKLIWAILLLLIWFLFAYLAYKLVIYTFKKFKIMEIIDKMTMSSYFKWENNKTAKASSKDEKLQEIKQKMSDIRKISRKMEIDKIVAKSFSYYIFLVFFRFAVVVIWIKEVEKFLWDVLNYLPDLFIALVIWFFGIRFASSVYNIVYYTLKLTNDKTSKIIANWARIIILFFTLMWVLAKAWIAVFIINTVLIWFIAMLALAWWLAFWLGWKDIAKEILESFKK